ncbi:hypothetical protein [Mycobacterium simiae]|nr:hypothetical protein [Mycobacterium simiae]
MTDTPARQSPPNIVAELTNGGIRQEEVADWEMPKLLGLGRNRAASG